MRDAKDAAATARRAGLVYTSWRTPGITRRKVAKRFVYHDTRGKKITDVATLHRIIALAIPPAYQNVWISPHARAHIQAVGTDARGRLQYRYHHKWKLARDAIKYDRLLLFGKALPKIRRQVRRNLRLPGLPRQKVLATIVQLLQTTLIRVGNEEYARSNRSYGLTTILNEHVAVGRKKIHFEFRGKSGVDRKVDVEDARLADIVRQCRELPERELFEYIDEAGRRHDITSADVNDYLRRITGQHFTAKDFRTWGGTCLALAALVGREFHSEREGKKAIVAAVKEVAARLGNTGAVCRKAYIHPLLFERYMERTLLRKKAARKKWRELNKDEHALIALLSDAHSA